MNPLTNKTFGIDHPIIAVNDIKTTRQGLEKMGFTMTPIGKHPWGTSTCLAMFDHCLIEVMGIYDHSLLDANPTGDFCFGRHIYRFLGQREGVALTALHSTNIDADSKQAIASGLSLSGTLDFGRSVSLPNGTSGTTKTSLALFPDVRFPRLSLFLCQQHYPELVYVPEWMQHPNTAYGYAGISIVAEARHHELLQKKYQSLYGKVVACRHGFAVDTGNGNLRVLTHAALASELGKLPPAISEDKQPSIVAFDLYCKCLAKVEKYIRNNGMPYTTSCIHPYGQAPCLLLTNPSLTGNTFLRFIEK